jgi:hypothetical protein
MPAELSASGGLWYFRHHGRAFEGSHSKDQLLTLPEHYAYSSAHPESTIKLFDR